MAATRKPCGFEYLGRIGTPQGGGPAKAIGSWRAPGDTIRLAKGVLAGVAAVLTSTARSGRVEVLMPLFGGVRATVPQGQVARL